MKENGVAVTPHYTPLHLSDIGKRIGRFVGKDRNTSLGSESLVRLPIYHELGEEEQGQVVRNLHSFFASRLGSRL
jgi:dTDP-4-amino-4,6-dideoxygalactose transaminase